MTTQQRRLVCELIVEARLAADFLHTVEWTTGQTERCADDLEQALEKAIENIETALEWV